MGGGPKKSTSTTTAAPPEYLQGPLRNASIAANSQFNDARNGPNVLGQGRDLLSSTLQGDFLSPDSNPYLTDTFNRASDLTQTRLSSEFAGQGRDVAGSRPARSEELQGLSNQIFGGNFQAERDRQVNAIGQAGALDPTNQFIDQLAALTPGAGGNTSATQPIYSTGLF